MHAGTLHPDREETCPNFVHSRIGIRAPLPTLPAIGTELPGEGVPSPATLGDDFDEGNR